MDAVFVTADVESLLVEAEDSSLETTVPFERAVTFDPTVGSPSNFYMSFRNLFSLEWMWNHYSVRRRSKRSRPAYRFEGAVTFDATVGSPSNFYRSFGHSFPCSRCGIPTR
jgi:hypothetical protein